MSAGATASSSRSLAHRLLVGLPLTLAAGPPLVLADTLRRHTVDVPWVDQWAFAYEILRVHDGTATARDLWLQHNEHRIPVTKLVLHALALVSGWDVRWEVVANFIVGMAMIALVATTIVRTIRPVAPLAVGWLVLLAASLLTSLVQWQNWTWGWQLGLLLAEAGAITVAAALARASATPRAAAATVIVAALLAGLCNGTGMVLVGIAPLALLALRFAGVRIEASMVVTAAVAAAAFVGLYLVDWRPAVGQPAPVPIIANASNLARFALAFLGAPIAASDVTTATRWGAVAVAAIVAATARVWIAQSSWRAALVPWIALASFSIAAASLTAVGRLGAGMPAALLSRYTSFAIPMWVALGPIVVLATNTWPRREARVAIAAVAGAVMALATSHAWESSARGEVSMARRAAIARQAATCIVDPTTAPDACYRAICWDPTWARRGAIALRARHLGPWRPGGAADVAPHE